MADTVSLDQAADLVVRYLRAMEERDFDTAAGFVAEQAEFVFPGDRRPADLRAIAAGSSGRYRHVAKRIDGCDALRDGARTIVYCYGTLYGAWSNGEPFADIRFVDRFELVDGRIVSQRVWNDTAEIKALADAHAGGQGR